MSNEIEQLSISNIKRRIMHILPFIFLLFHRIIMIKKYFNICYDFREMSKDEYRHSRVPTIS